MRDSERRAKRLTKKTTAKLRRFEVNFSLCGFEGAKREGGRKRSKSEPNASEANGSRAKQLTERAEKAVREGSQTGKTDRKPAERRPFTIRVTIARGNHLYPSRTQKLSLLAPKVLGWQRPGRLGRRREPKA